MSLTLFRFQLCELYCFHNLGQRRWYYTCSQMMMRCCCFFTWLLSQTPAFWRSDIATARRQNQLLGQRLDFSTLYRQVHYLLYKGSIYSDMAAGNATTQGATLRMLIVTCAVSGVLFSTFELVCVSVLVHLVLIKPTNNHTTLTALFDSWDIYI